MKFIPVAVTRTIGRTVLKTKKNSPHLFFVGGVVGVVGSHVLVARATLKLEPVLDEIKTDLEKVKVSHDVVSVENAEFDKEYLRDLTKVYGTSAIKLIKLYGPAIGVGVASITALTGSHIQMTRRNAALTATATALTKAFDEYRIRVQEAIGEEKEQAIYLGFKDEEIVDEDGKKRKIKSLAKMPSPYARFFDECSTQWQKSEEYNRFFLECQQNYANHRLHAYGHVFLNEVYDWLGLERSSQGAIVGWVVDGDGDGYIDFGMYETGNERFINQMDRRVLLDFNVDGPIFDKI